MNKQLDPTNFEAVSTQQHCLCLIHPMDPRGEKVGGIQTHVRQMLQHAPPHFRVLLVGVDGRGDCELGRILPLDMNGRKFDFLPVIHFPESQVHASAKMIAQSITLRFALGLLRNLIKIRSAIGSGPASIELQRYEFSLIPFLLRIPAVQVIHGDGSKENKMDSLLKKYWYLHRINEAVATRLAKQIICVNPDIERRFKDKLPHAVDRITFMPVSVDTRIFRPVPFDSLDGVFRVVFAGRFDEFKDPPMMFRTLQKVHERIGGALEFHYVGTSDPHRYLEFKPIEAFTIRHGFQAPQGVAAIMAKCHVGMLTSYFEGMPCYLLEVLSIGRPVVAVRLPQYDLVIEEGISGSMVERVSDKSALADALADRLVAVWDAIRVGQIEPRAVHRKIQRFSIETQLAGHFARHEGLRDRGQSLRQVNKLGSLTN
jgi:glycosyltransferase involved in cell wall biosynthesis